MKSLPRSEHIPMTLRTREESKKKRCEKKELTKSKLKLLPVTRRMLRLIGLGKNLKKRKIVRNSLRILMSRRRPVSRSSSRRTFSLKPSLTNSRERMKSTSRPSSNKMMILISSLKQCASNLMICVKIIMIKLTISKLHSSEKEAKLSKETLKKLDNCFPSTQSLRMTTRLKRAEKRKSTYKILRSSVHKMQMIKLNKRLNLRKKCRFYRNVWKT